MYLKIFQKGFNYSQDGQGNRLVYHLQGCNMHCAWCANPEGMSVKGVLVTDKEWLWDGLCPLGAVRDKKLNRLMCEQCKERLCLTAKYKSKGIRCSYESVAIEDVFAEVLSSRPMFYDGGGVTFTGGEATLQLEAMKELLKRIHETGVHTAIETNGSHPKLDELFPYVDQLIMDLKHGNEEKHFAYTGIHMNMVADNLKKAAGAHGRLDVRTPVIGGVNDAPEEFRELLWRYNGLKGDNVTFELLRYHEYGRNKWEECGLSYEMTEDAHVTVEQMKEFQRLMVENGLTYKRS